MLTSGENLSHYKIISAIGAGGMGEVYLAEDTRLDRQVAIKFLNEEFSRDSEKLSRFVQEAKAASALNHPNILTVYEIGNHENSRYITTELIKGATLREHMRGEPLRLVETLEIALQIAAALCAAHEAGIIHRDIKPENIMVREDGLVKVLDFGLAKLSERSGLAGGLVSSEDATRAQFNTQPGMVMGTVAYMSPEQARGKKLDARSDIFSLGIVMFELFTGKRPFDGEGHLDLISSILKDDPPSLRQVLPALPRQLERIVDKTLRKDRDYRYQHVKDLHIDLEDLRDELKFEAKLNQTAETTVPATAQVTNENSLRSTLTTGIAATRRFTLLHAFLFALIAIGVTGAVWYYSAASNSASAIAGSLKTREVAAWSSAPGELFSNASFSPDGKMIAFASTKSGTKNIWVTQTASTEAIPVTNDEFSNTDPIWSPVGDEIAFFSQRGNLSDGRTNFTAWRVSALGGIPRSIGPIIDGSSELRRWAASGKLYYQPRRDELYAMDIATGTSQKVTAIVPNSGPVSWVDISADEKATAYILESDGVWKMFLADAAGANSKKVAEGRGEIADGVAWLPEKNRIFYGVMVDGVFQIFVMNTGTGQSSPITSSDTDSVVVDAAPEGESVIFSSAKEESNLWRVAVSDGQEAPIARDLNSKIWPSISPDNERVAFQSIKNLSRGNNLYESFVAVKSVKGRAESENPTRLAERGILPAWSPDGSAIAFIRKNGDKLDLFYANPSGGGEKQLAVSVQVIGYSVSPYNHVQTRAFSWSPDGGKIAYVSEKNGSANVWTVARLDGSDAALTDNRDSNYSFYCPIWSADGKRLAYFSQQKKADANGKTMRGLRIVEVETGRTVSIFDSDKIFRLIGWTADESGLIIAESEKQSGLPPETVLKRIAIEARSETSIIRLKNAYFYNIFLSGDRKSIAYAARNQDKDDIWVISSTGGGERKLTNNNDSGLYYSRLAWLHDGSAIVFGKQMRFSLLSIINNIK